MEESYVVKKLLPAVPQEEWVKKENENSILLLTREEWLKRTNETRGSRDKSRMRCFNCGIYGHFAADSKKPSHNKETKPEAHMTQT
ncbi:hypothetical protein AgCh_022819 [Apium graveolens]